MCLLRPLNQSSLTSCGGQPGDEMPENYPKKEVSETLIGFIIGTAVVGGPGSIR